MKKKSTNTHSFSLLVHVRATGKTKRIAQREVKDLAKRIRNLEAGGFSPVHGDTGYSVAGVEAWPKAGHVTHEKIAQEEIRITGVFDLKNMVATGAFEDTSTADVENLFDWLANNSPDNPKAFLPEFLREQLEPITQHLADHFKVAEIETETMGTRFTNREVYEEAAKDFSHPDFAVFVRIDTPIRMYRPDGEYESSWGYSRGLYGFGADYESALRHAYQTVMVMREERLI